MFGRRFLTPRALEYRARERAAEAGALERLRRPHSLLDTELAEIVRDPYAGIAREIADDELKRRDGLTAHQRIAEAARRAECP